ncbi:MAG: hypothetical protein JWO30_2229 [Fibrobacteres bacterium]|nr:hypothetical protein [Fibrobacterota bacterium]
MEHIIAESTFDKGLSEEEENRGAKEIDTNLEKAGGHWLRSYYSKDRKRIICEFEAPDAEAVKSAYSAAGFPLDNAWPAEVYAGETLKAGG